MIRRSVDLPLPLGPRSAVSDPVATSIDTSSRATYSSNVFVMWRTEIDISCLLSFGWRKIIAIKMRIAVAASTKAMP